MCGIAGSIHKNLTDAQAAACLEKMAHRGPDDMGMYRDGDLWLGHRRLSIQDVSERGHQPMVSEDENYVLVYNGELYNNAALREDLQRKGFSFRSQSDTETLLKAYIAYGKECLSRLNGIFAFALYNKSKQELWVVRDPLGVKPLYYYTDGESFLFASELKSLLHLPLNYSLDQTAFYRYLSLLYSPGTVTPFRHIHKLLPGHYLVIDTASGKIKEEKTFYRAPFNGQYEPLSEKEWLDELDKQLTNAVKQQLLSDVPVGYFLSGGLDSSLILAIAKKLQPGLPLQAFTIDTGHLFKEEGFDDDLPYAQKVAKWLNVPLQVIPADSDVLKNFDQMIWQLDEPQTDPASLFVQQIATAAREKGIKVLLGGTGADDVFAGYKRHLALHLEKYLSKIPTPVQKGIKTIARLLPQNAQTRRVQKLLQPGQTPLQRRTSYYYWLPQMQTKELFRTELRSSLPDLDVFFLDLLKEIPAEQSPLNQMLYWELHSFLPDQNLNYTDKMGMAAGVEIRVPFLDTHIIALAAKMPPSLKLKGKETKYILKKLAERYLPHEIIYRPKTGFGAPIRQWVNNEMKEMVGERLSEETLLRSGIFEPSAVKKLISDTASGTTDGAYAIWSLLAIDSWLQQFSTKCV
ncbi:asparagine synthase (glutamine-hydrolyzing) [Taibaiella soli]|uniref:asparagine synthase (glutamine-hydrolyzing) n=1 Tax=Taibaiella soli TaxID=1649169 RepID=A0A2W2BE82_9BACT|nr:asparagine synthase (glutamine-hydrolyzing) [Taibaiella soli]PZF74197.1 asparagine synthase (glutamine-hydrolyzing) [Taibaiella soli]